MQNMEIAAKSPNALQDLKIPLFALGGDEAKTVCGTVMATGLYRVENAANKKLDLKFKNPTTAGADN